MITSDTEVSTCSRSETGVLQVPNHFFVFPLVCGSFCTRTFHIVSLHTFRKSTPVKNLDPKLPLSLPIPYSRFPFLFTSSRLKQVYVFTYTQDRLRLSYSSRRRLRTGTYGMGHPVQFLSVPRIQVFIRLEVFRKTRLERSIHYFV